MVFQAAAWIYVWPAVLRGSPGILSFVDGANCYIIVLIIAVIAPAFREILWMGGVILLLFGVPLVWVAITGGDPVIINLMVSDTSFSIVTGMVLASLTSAARLRLAELEARKEGQLKTFLNPIVAEAILKGRNELLVDRVMNGYILSLDIRGSTILQKKYRERWDAFRSAYLELVSRRVHECGGYIYRSVGDGHVITFGILDPDVDLSEVPGIEFEAGQAEERRLVRVAGNCMRFLLALSEIQDLAFRMLDGEVVRMGVGIDRGKVRIRMAGVDTAQKEVDLHGDPLICAARLQEHTKGLAAHHPEASSIVLISPYASDYLVDVDGLSRVGCMEQPVRDYEGIRWLFMKKVLPPVRSEESRAA